MVIERRRAKRLKDDDEVAITIFADGRKFPKEKVVYNNSKDISLLGARMKADIYLPVNNFIKTEMKLKSKYPMITIVGQVKWIKAILNDDSFEAGVEFVTPPNDVIQNLKDYISWISGSQSDETNK